MCEHRITRRCMRELRRSWGGRWSSWGTRPSWRLPVDRASFVDRWLSVLMLIMSFFDDAHLHRLVIDVAILWNQFLWRGGSHHHLSSSSPLFRCVDVLTSKMVGTDKVWRITRLSFYFYLVEHLKHKSLHISFTTIFHVNINIRYIG